MAKRVAKSDTAPDHAAPAARPALLSEVIGQTSAKRILTAAMRSGRVHHAWIFHGPAGIGKFTAALAFAAAILDPTTGPGLTGEFEPEPGSPVQKLCRGGSHPDLHIITKELAAISRNPQVRNSKQTNIARDVLEEFLLEPAARTRIMLGESLAGKVFIIDEADLLDPRGQNTLLKTLEEPPAGTVIILVTSNEDRLLPTIRSRCQRVAFQPLDDAEMDAWFKTDAAAALRAADAAQLKWIRGFASGAPGLASLAAEASLFDWHTTLAPLLGQLDKGQFPPDLGGTLAKLVGDRAEADVKANPDASKDGANKVWGRRMLSFLAEAYRARLRAAAAASSDPDHPATQRWLACLDSIHAAEGHLASNVNLTMLFENLAAQLALEPALN